MMTEPTDDFDFPRAVCNCDKEGCVCGNPVYEVTEVCDCCKIGQHIIQPPPEDDTEEEPDMPDFEPPNVYVPGYGWRVI